MTAERPGEEGAMATAATGDYQRKAQTGWWVALGLAGLTAIEFVIAITVEDALIWMLPFAAAKGWLILDYFMHVRDLFREEGH